MSKPMQETADIIAYWRSIEPFFAEAVRQIEDEEENRSSDNLERFNLVLKDWSSLSLDIERLLEIIERFPLGQALYVARRSREERLSILPEMVKNPVAEACTRRIRATINRRWFLRAFDYKEIVLVARKAEQLP